jgi:amino acid transporter
MSFASASDVFTNYHNFSDWDGSVAIAFTFFGATWSISGWASPAFLVEETHKGHRTVAKAIIISFVAMAWIGAAVCLVIAFCITDIAAAAADPTYVSLDSLFLKALKRSHDSIFKSYWTIKG